jgi:DNA-binding HxlR family transcriptional regulator
MENTEVDYSARDQIDLKDALQALQGFWKLQILVVLFAGPKRFKDIGKEVDGISDKMLSKELKDLEKNALVSRKVYETFPPKVEYSATEHTKSLAPLLNELKNWGRLHREVVIRKGA